jgi:hypothetical protein
MVVLKVSRCGIRYEPPLAALRQADAEARQAGAPSRGRLSH